MHIQKSLPIPFMLVTLFEYDFSRPEFDLLCNDNVKVCFNLETSSKIIVSKSSIGILFSGFTRFARWNSSYGLRLLFSVWFRSGENPEILTTVMATYHPFIMFLFCCQNRKYRNFFTHLVFIQRCDQGVASSRRR